VVASLQSLMFAAWPEVVTLSGAKNHVRDAAPMPQIFSFVHAARQITVWH
jgi:hypothetical protein